MTRGPMITTGGKCVKCGCQKWMHAVVYDVPEEGDISTQAVCVQCRTPAPIQEAAR